ncbi:hypothetical protein D9M69_411710 [compost metagenome]
MAGEGLVIPRAAGLQPLACSLTPLNQAPGVSVDPCHPLTLCGPVAFNEIGAVTRRLRRQTETVRFAEGIQRGVDREWISLIDHGGIQRVHQQDALAGMGRDQGETVGHPKVRRVELRGSTSRGLCNPPFRRTQGLLVVVGEQPRSTRVAE